MCGNAKSMHGNATGDSGNTTGMCGNATSGWGDTGVRVVMQFVAELTSHRSTQLVICGCDLTYELSSMPASYMRMITDNMHVFV